MTTSLIIYLWLGGALFAARDAAHEFGGPGDRPMMVLTAIVWPLIAPLLIIGLIRAIMIARSR